MKNVKKWLMALALSSIGLSSYAMPAKIAPVPLPPIIIDDESLVQTPLGIVVSPKINEKELPSIVMPWVDWVKAKNNKEKCLSSNENEKSCIFAPLISIEENEKTLLFSINGVSHVNEFWFKLPYANKVWPEAVTVNGQKSQLLEKDGSPIVLINKGEFTLRFAINKLDLMNNPSLVLPQEFLIVKNKTTQSIIAENNQITFINKKELVIENKNISQEIKVYRNLIDDIPLRLDTRIKITYAGKEKEVFLGKVIPESFNLISITSPLSINEKEDGFYVRVTSGEHWLNFQSYSFKDLKAINVKGAVNTVEQEYWSIQNNPNLRQLDIKGVNPIDPNQAFYPQEWRGQSAYLVKDNIALETTRRGLNQQERLSSKINRTSWYGFNDEKVLHLDKMVFNNEGKSFIYFDSSIKPKEFTQNGQAQMIVKNEDKEGIVIAQGNYPTTLYSQTALDFNNKFITDSKQEVEQWNFTIAPRHRLLYASGVDKVYNSWFDNWNLYTVFAIFLISLGFYKLFGLPLALLSFSSIFLFQSNPFLAWTIWPSLLLLMALLKVLPENNKFTRLVRGLSVFMVISVAFTFVAFTVQEFRYTLNGSLEKNNNYIQSYQNEDTASMEIAMPAPMVASAPMMNKSMRGARVEQFNQEIKSIESQKVQVTTGQPTWSGINYRVISSGESEVKFYVAKPWLVNIAGLIQVLDLLLVLIFLILYVLGIYNKQEIMHHITPSLKNNSFKNSLFKKILGDKNA